VLLSFDSLLVKNFFWSLFEMLNEALIFVAGDSLTEVVFDSLAASICCPVFK